MEEALGFSEKRERSYLFVDLCNRRESSFPVVATAACSSSVFARAATRRQSGTRPAVAVARAGTAATVTMISVLMVYHLIELVYGCRRASPLEVPRLVAMLDTIPPRTKNVLLSSWGAR